MHIEQMRPGIFRVTLSGYELAALSSAARWVVEGAKGEFTPEAIQQLQAVVACYDKAIKRLKEEKDPVRRMSEQ